MLQEIAWKFGDWVQTRGQMHDRDFSRGPNNLTPSLGGRRLRLWGLPFLSLATASILLLYGFKFHRITVTESHEIETTIQEPVTGFDPIAGSNSTNEIIEAGNDDPSLPPSSLEPPGPGFSPFPGMGPAMKSVKVYKTVTTTQDEPEPKIIPAITVSALTLSSENKIVRLNNNDAGGPAYCPT